MGALDRKVVLVTGAGRGIGRAIALSAAEDGAAVAVVDHGGPVFGTDDDGATAGSATTAQETVDLIRAGGGRAIAFSSDVTDAEAVDEVFEGTVSEFGRLDGVVLAAGTLVHARLWEMTERQWDDIVDVHLKGQFLCTRAAARAFMPQASGKVVLFSSHSALAGSAVQAGYATAKAGVLGLLRVADHALRPYGINVNCILPGGATRMTDLIHSEAGTLTDQPTLGLRSDLAAGTWRDPVNVAPFALYLLSDRSNGVSGKAFAVVGYQVSEVVEPRYGRTIRNDGPWNPATVADAFEAEFGTDLKPPEHVWPPA